MLPQIAEKSQRWGPLIRQAAFRHGLDPVLVAAIVMQESGGDPDAVRYEDNFFHTSLRGKGPKKLPGFWPKRCSEATEMRLRACSFGLMQILGETAREQGYQGEFLSGLFNPAVNLEEGCRFFAKLLKECDGDTRKALLRWNGGGYKPYPKEVFAWIERGECQHLLV